MWLGGGAGAWRGERVSGVCRKGMEGADFLFFTYASVEAFRKVQSYCVARMCKRGIGEPRRRQPRPFLDSFLSTPDGCAPIRSRKILEGRRGRRRILLPAVSGEASTTRCRVAPAHGGGGV